MQRFLSVFLAMALLIGCFAGCDSDSGGSKKNKNLLELDMYSYDISIMMSSESNEPEEVSLVLSGKLPEKETTVGSFDGEITITDAQGKKHTYENMIYAWVNDFLFLKNEDAGNRFSLIYDPEDPEKSVFIDMEWGLADAELALLVYLNNDLTQTQAEVLGEQIQKIDQVKEYRFVSAQQAYDELVETLGANAMTGVNVSDLQHRYHVTLKAGADELAAVEALEGIYGVDEVSGNDIMLFYRIILPTNVESEIAELIMRYEGLEFPQQDQSETTLPQTDDLPKAYAAMNAEYKRLVEYRLSSGYSDSDGFTPSTQLQAAIDRNSLQYQWDLMVEELQYYSYDGRPTLGSYGYMLADLNQDGVEEMLWVSTDYQNVYAIFTLVGEEAVLLDCFWSRYDCVILDDGTIYTVTSGGASYYEYAFMMVDAQTGKLKIKTAFGCDGGSYYQVNQGQWQSINSDLFYAMLEGYPMEFGSNWYYRELIALK